MTVTFSQQTTQLGPGAPLAITAVMNTNASDSDTIPFDFLGVTTTPTAPATFAAFAHTDAGNDTSTFWDSLRSPGQDVRSGGVLVTSIQTITRTKFKSLDSNYAVGRYLWYVGFASAIPAAGDAPTALSGSYHIR